MSFKRRTKVPTGNKDERLANLHAWSSFYKQVPLLETEQEVQEYINLEMKHFKRSYVVLRLHGRYSILRGRRERAEIEAKCNGKG